MHRVPAGLPSGIPGIGEVIEGAIQQAPQPFFKESDMQGDQSDTSIE
jgi:hypothetical protein